MIKSKGEAYAWASGDACLEKAGMGVVGGGRQFSLNKLSLIRAAAPVKFLSKCVMKMRESNSSMNIQHVIEGKARMANEASKYS